MITAITREVSPRLDECELSFQDRRPIDIGRTASQHEAYRAALTELGARVVCLPALDGFPDCVFVEDPVVVLDEIAIVTRMGAESRRGETSGLVDEVAKHRELLSIESPGTLEGGDVLRVGKTLYVGLSQRTNVEGIQQLAKLTAPFGYWVTPVEVRGCLHLKTACTWIGDRMLANRRWIDLDGFCGVKFLDVPEQEPYAANTLSIGQTVLLPAAASRTRNLLTSEGYRVQTVDISELAKAEAGLTCLSLLISE